MPKMSLDFSITQMYRLFANDLLIMYDALVFYRKYKKSGQTVKEFSEVLANLVDVESENFEDIRAISKASHVENENVSMVVWDYMHDVVVKHFLDDISQYPFWAAKIAVTTQHQVFGFPVIQSWFEALQSTYSTRGVRGLFQGLAPYLVASLMVNYKFVLRSTNEFIVSVLAKIPHHAATSPQQSAKPVGTAVGISPPPSSVGNQHTTTLDKQMLRGPAPVLSGPRPARRRGSSKRAPQVQEESLAMSMVSNAAVVALSHPFLVTAANMVTDATLHGTYCVGAYWTIVARSGFRGLYKGIRTRTILSLLPLSPLLLLGISDSIIYRRILGQGAGENSGTLVSVLREIVSRDGGGALSLLNYGLVTLVQIVPGFLSFLAVRATARLLFGTSLQRKLQVGRRKEIVESHLNTLGRKVVTGNSSSRGVEEGTNGKGLARTRSAHFSEVR